MKSRTSYFDKTVLKKDLTRFFPLWALYLIGGLLIMHMLSGFYNDYFNDRSYSIARGLNSIIGPMGLVNAGYAFLAAQLLFGDLHSSRLCYGVHAFPLRREGWYLTHLASGLLMGFVPPMVIVLTLMPIMGQFWFTGLLCWGGLALHYLFFFALTVFCMMATGNRFAATAIYGIINFLSLIAHWFTETIYIPLLPGVRVTGDVSELLSPPVTVVQLQDFFRVEHLGNCSQCSKFTVIAPGTWYDELHEYAYQGLGESWLYLLILAGVGIALLALGLMLYRRRHLERAGDFMAFKPMKPIFLTVYTLCIGGGMFFFGETFGDASTGYLLFVIGIFIGFFTGKMLLERTVRVFNRKSFKGIGILYGAVALSLLLTWLDPIGISRYVPDSEKVEAVYLCDGHLSDYQLNNSDRLPYYNNIVEVTDPEDIAQICEIHSIMLQEHKDDPNSGRFFTLQYKMKNGMRVSRTYRIDSFGQAWQQLNPHMTKPLYLFGVSTLETLQQETTHVYSSELGEIPHKMWPSLLEAMWLDAQEGYLSTTGNHIPGYNLMYMELQLSHTYRALYFTEAAPHLQQWMKQYESSPQLLLQYDSLKSLQAATTHIFCPELDLELKKDQCTEFLQLLWQDCQNGLVSGYGKWSSGITVEIQTPHKVLSLTLSPTSKSAQWLISLAATLG